MLISYRHVFEYSIFKKQGDNYNPDYQYIKLGEVFYPNAQITKRLCDQEYQYGKFLKEYDKKELENELFDSELGKYFKRQILERENYLYIDLEFLEENEEIDTIPDMVIYKHALTIFTGSFDWRLLQEMFRCEEKIYRETKYRLAEEVEEIRKELSQLDIHEYAIFCYESDGWFLLDDFSENKTWKEVMDKSKRQFKDLHISITPFFYTDPKTSKLYIDVEKIEEHCIKTNAKSEGKNFMVYYDKFK